ncbi:MAG: hypothetical protein K6F14_00995 [Clostridiales bacterium]|nr:hypothetical protein [Clostridiales bacterium]
MNITENIKRIVSVDFNCGYKTKLFDKNDVKGFLYLTKRSFKKLKKDSDEPPYVVGDVYIKRKRYEDIDTADDPQYLAWKKESLYIVFIEEFCFVAAVEIYGNNSFNIFRNVHIKHPFVLHCHC